MIKDPDLALSRLDQYQDFKVPVFINGSIHGDEYPGTDALIRLIETLAYTDTPEVQAVLEHVILLINVVQNPDGTLEAVSPEIAEKRVGEMSEEEQALYRKS